MFPAIDDYDTCVECGRARVVGDWPRCPHGPVAQPGADGHTTTYQDSIPGGLVLENYGPQPITVYSHTERRQVMQQNGLNLREKFSPYPGTDKDPAGIPNPAGYLDATTLDNAKVLILRQQQGRAARPVDDIKVTPFRTSLTNEDAITVQHESEVEHARRPS